LSSRWASLLAWPHTGFGAHVSREIPADPRSWENVARYVAHPLILVDRIRGDPSGGILDTGKAIHPGPRANCRVVDPLEFLAESSAHLADPHETTALDGGGDATRTRGVRNARGLLAPPDPGARTADADLAPLALRRTWARLIRRVDKGEPRATPSPGRTPRRPRPPPLPTGNDGRRLAQAPLDPRQKAPGSGNSH